MATSAFIVNGILTERLMSITSFRGAMCLQTVWNLVLACKTCNADKSNRTPTDHYINLLLDRNRKLPPDHKDLREFSSKDLEDHIRTWVSNCRSDEFGVWNVPVADNALIVLSD